MKLKFILGLLSLTAALSAHAQQPSPSPPQTTPQKTVSQIDEQKDDDSKSTNATTTYVRPDRKTRQKRYVKSIFGPVALAKTVVSAGFSTARNSPEEWGGTWEGFGRRVASGFGKNAIKQTTLYALDESFKLDSKFYYSPNRSFGAKVKNALVSPFVARTASGKKVFGFPRVVSTYTSHIIAAETWYPKRYDYKQGLRSATISFGITAAFNLVKEFIKK
jgi:hypothetical protein